MRKLKNIKKSAITQWTRQLATLLNAHIPLLQALDLLTQAQHRPPLQQLTQTIYQEIQQGNPLSVALRRHAAVFDKTYCQLIYAAEQSGALPAVLQKIAEQQLLREQIQQQLVKALIYPALVLTVGIGVFILLLTWVVPQLAQVFKQFSAQLPWFTQLILDAAGFLQQYAVYFLLLLFFMSCLILVLIKQVTAFAIFLARQVWHCPGIGHLLQQAACVLFSRTLFLLLSAGIPIASCLPIVLQVIANPYAQQRLRIATLLIRHLSKPHIVSS
jgi:type IV pilus assembly protein PilC